MSNYSGISNKVDLTIRMGVFNKVNQSESNYLKFENSTFVYCGKFLVFIMAFIK